ncbi:hypothetical protein BC629DRAFT_1520881 [Irpex lacteus]|nr:hypothetical protein BC629DRAFT_1520881 [Irpex lacteus]
MVTFPGRASYFGSALILGMWHHASRTPCLCIPCYGSVAFSVSANAYVGEQNLWRGRQQSAGRVHPCSHAGGSSRKVIIHHASLSGPHPTRVLTNLLAQHASSFGRLSFCDLATLNQAPWATHSGTTEQLASQWRPISPSTSLKCVVVGQKSNREISPAMDVVQHSFQLSMHDIAIQLASSCASSETQPEASTIP